MLFRSIPVVSSNVTQQSTALKIKQYVFSTPIAATANISAPSFLGNVFGNLTGNLIGSINVTAISANTIQAKYIGNSGASLTGVLQTAAQPYVTSVGTLTSLILSGGIVGTSLQAATIGNSGASITAGNITAGNLTASGSVTAAYLYGNASGVKIGRAHV